MSPLRRGLLALVTVAVLWPAGNAIAAPPAGSGNAATPAAGDPASFASGLELPAAAGALAPNLRPGGLLSWLEPVATSTGSGHRLLFARPRGDGWAPPQPVVEGTDFFANWADLPAVVELPGGGLVASWLAQAGEDPYAYGIRLAVSKDGGESFAPVGWLHRDRSENEHGFVSLVPRRDAGAWAFWLDGGALDTGGAMQLHTATVLGPSGDTVTGEEVLDPRVCECCTTSAARTADGPVVVYRGRTESEIRDIRIVRRTGEGWSEPKTVADDAWRVSGCPVNGPAIDADGRRVVVAWFTGGEPGPRVRVAFSKDGGASFGRPFDVDSENPRGRVDVALLADGDAVVSWLGRGDEGSEVRLRRVGPDGGASASWTIAETTGNRSAGFPRLGLDGEALRLVWRDGSTPPRLRWARIPQDAEPLTLATAGTP